MGTEYERELKKLLEGNLQAIVKMKKTCSAGEALGYGVCENYPFMVIRGAGSFGVDLVALRGELSFPIEVKSSIHEKVYLSQPRLKEQLQVAAAKHRLLLLSGAPEIPEELVSGETVDEVEKSLAAAREVVDKVKIKLEAKLLTERVPAGAPPRSSADLSTLSPKDKIAYALSRK